MPRLFPFAFFLIASLSTSVFVPQSIKAQTRVQHSLAQCRTVGANADGSMVTTDPRQVERLSQISGSSRGTSPLPEHTVLNCDVFTGANCQKVNIR